MAATLSDQRISVRDRVKAIEANTNRKSEASPASILGALLDDLEALKVHLWLNEMIHEDFMVILCETALKEGEKSFVLKSPIRCQDEGSLYKYAAQRVREVLTKDVFKKLPGCIVAMEFLPGIGYEVRVSSM